MTRLGREFRESLSRRLDTLYAVDRASAAGVPISFDANHRTSLWGGRDFLPTYQTIGAQSTLVFAGEDEARLLVPDAQSVAELAKGIAGLGPSHVIIKQGPVGSYALVGGRAYSQASVKVNVVDTVGAGDAFVAGFLAEHLANQPVEICLETAVTVGAFACLAPGDWEGSPTRSELPLLHAI